MLMVFPPLPRPHVHVYPVGVEGHPAEHAQTIRQLVQFRWSDVLTLYIRSHTQCVVAVERPAYGLVVRPAPESRRYRDREPNLVSERLKRRYKLAGNRCGMTATRSTFAGKF